ncbi:MAG TPA: low molecular weight phosphotyrosine protein phosphatase [Micavibrio sp.]|nr:low molecular weight phosphotyrosine protein phosphatase [Micavibrio sp.]
MKQKLLFVCTGNICRSPTADGVFRHMVQQANLADLYVGDSAGTHGYHVGERPDLRAIQIGAKRGYSFSDLRARQLVSNDFEEFDYVLAMDAGHLRQMQRMNAGRDHATICMFTDFLDDHDKGIDVPDPYYGDLKGFEQVLDLVEKSTAALIDHLQKQSRQD